MSDPREQAVRRANLAFYQALHGRDLDLMERVWCHEEIASCVHPGWKRLHGWRDIRRSWAAIFQNTQPWNVRCDEVRVGLTERDAWVTCVEVIRPASAAPHEPPSFMQATNIFVEREGQWRMIHHHASPSPADEVPSGPVN